jgi:iron complex outermembrane recepter protein
VNYKLFMGCSALTINFAFSQMSLADVNKTLYSVILPTQTVAEALYSLAEQVDVPVFFPFHLVKNRQANPVDGHYTLQQAIDILLQGTGLSGGLSDKGVLTVSIAEPEANHNEGEETMKTKRSILAAAIGFFLGSGGVPQVAAQSENVRQENSDRMLEEVIVTATKRAESLQEVPIAITAFGTEQLETLAPSNLIDLSSAVPNMLMLPAMGGGGNRINIRGLGITPGRSSGTAVGLYVDGVYQSNNTALNVSMMDVERVEVLKGPQGTLFGRDTIGGAINIVNKAPGDEFTGQLALELGDLDHRKLQASADIPLLEDMLVARLSVQKEKEDGYVRNTFDNSWFGAKDTFNGRVQLYFAPTDQWNIRLTYTRSDSESAPANGEPINNLQGERTPYVTNVNGPSFQKLEVDSLSLFAEYEFESGYTITSISAHNKIKDIYTQDTDFTSLPNLFEVFSGESEDYSQELRLTSPVNDVFDYIIGIYYFKNDNEHRDIYIIDQDSYAQSLGFPAGFVFPPKVQDGQEKNFVLESTAVFVHTNYHMTDDFTVFGGVRYTSDKKENDYSIFGSIAPILGFPNITHNISKTEDDPVSWTVGARYNIEENTMAYASVARGFRSGAVKDDFVTPADIAADSGFFTEPEFVTNYEVGLKSLTLEGRLQTNIAVFYMDYTDKISSKVVPNTFTSALTNASSATIKGLEIDSRIQLTEGLQLTASAGYLKSEYGEFQPRADLDLSGKSIGRHPDLSYSLALDYDQALSNGGTFLAHADVSYKGEYSSDGQTNIEEVIGDDLGDYETVNASVSYIAASERWNLTFRVENLLDSDDIIFGQTWNFGQGPLVEHAVAIYEKPRTYTMTLGLNF